MYSVERGRKSLCSKGWVTGCEKTESAHHQAAQTCWERAYEEHRGRVKTTNTQSASYPPLAAAVSTEKPSSWSESLEGEVETEIGRYEVAGKVCAGA